METVMITLILVIILILLGSVENYRELIKLAHS